ncbi:MAG: DNA polymerase I [Mobilibacterium timonense]|uniref:DNA polymerase I n=2 Tax=Mobilibacterium timonense TaxID=1871012 RepID=UPI0023525F1E|nr:DNA polymerase I [Mobilibacterium timonense]MBM6991074.1 DNA polymerase I [Mobilibacterium timonense]
MEKLIIIDGNSLLFRGYFAMRPMVTKDGVYTQGVYAFVNMLSRILQEGEPDYIAVAFDMRKPTFRHEIYKDYKGGRQKTPPELLAQIPIMKRVLEAMNIKVMELETYEADDIIGTVTADAEKAGIESLIISGDKDELQLIGPHTRVMINKKGVTDFDIYDTDAMQERYGLTPERFIDLKGLMGDSSDNLPGIKGVGEKKGLALLEEYGTVEGVIEHSDEIKGKLGENVREHKEDALMTKKLATIKRDVPIQYDFSELKYTDPDYESLIKIYQELQFNSFISRLRKRAGGDAEEAIGQVSSLDKIEDKADSLKDVAMTDFLKEVGDGSSVVFWMDTDDSHLETPSARRVAVLDPEKKLFSRKELTPLDQETILEQIAGKRYALTGFDLKPACYTMAMLGLSALAPEWDIAVAEYLIDPNQSGYTVEKMAAKYLGVIPEKKDQKVKSKGKEEQERELSDDELKKLLVSVENIRRAQAPVMEELGVDRLFRGCEMPLINTLAAMECAGMKVDVSVLERSGQEIQGYVDDLESQIIKEAGQTFNVNSPKQLSQVLFEDMEIPYPGRKKTGTLSTSADILEKLQDEYPVCGKVLQYRKYKKLLGTYVEGLIPLICYDGRIRPHFNQTVAATGRLSCTEPNLQNIPVRDDYGRALRKAFVVSGDDMLFVGADYSQIELRIMAFLSGDENLIDAFNKGEDIHRITASRVFNIPLDQVTSRDRSRAKAVNFGIIYGISGFGLSEDLHIPRGEAQQYIDEYFVKHQAVKEFLDRQIQEGKDTRLVRTYFGRVRQIPEFSSRKYMDRQLANRLAMNTPIQGTAADIIKIAMNKVYEELTERKMKSRLILQIHDELIIEAVESEVEDVKELLVRNMESAADLAVDLKCDVSTGKTWYDLK